jgi:hypothetical protein
MATSEMTVEQQQALQAANLGNLKKKINADSWTSHMEDLMKKWGEKAAGLRWMHQQTQGKWKKTSDKLTIYGIVATTLASTASFATAGMENADAAMYAVGAIGMVAAIIQSLKKFYNADEKVAEHGAIAKQFGSFYRYMTLQLNMSRADRVPADELTNWALKEFERLQQDSPPVDGETIKNFKKEFPNCKNVPDLAADNYEISIYIPTPEGSVNSENLD